MKTSKKRIYFSIEGYGKHTTCCSVIRNMYNWKYNYWDNNHITQTNNRLECDL